MTMNKQNFDLIRLNKLKMNYAIAYRFMMQEKLHNTLGCYIEYVSSDEYVLKYILLLGCIFFLFNFVSLWYASFPELTKGSYHFLSCKKEC